MKPRRLPLDAILITVPSGIGKHVGHSSRRNNNWVKQLSHLGQVACVDSHPTSMPGHYSIENLLDQLLSSTRAKIDEVKVKYPARPIILIGWNVGAGIAVQAALMESVHSVICLGFPISTLAGNFCVLHKLTNLASFNGEIRNAFKSNHNTHLIIVIRTSLFRPMSSSIFLISHCIIL